MAEEITINAEDIVNALEDIQETLVGIRKLLTTASEKKQPAPVVKVEAPKVAAPHVTVKPIIKTPEVKGACLRWINTIISGRHVECTGKRYGRL